MKNLLKRTACLLVTLTALFTLSVSISLAEDAVEEAIVPVETTSQMMETTTEKVFTTTQEDIVTTSPTTLEEASTQATTQEDTQAISEEATETTTSETADSATEETTLPAKEERVFNGSIAIRLLGSNFQYGDMLTLEATLTGHEGFTYSLCWEYSENGEDWFAAPGVNNELCYQYTLTEGNVSYQWRLAVDII